MNIYDVIVVGSGNAALCAALSAKDNGAKKILVIEKAKKNCLNSGLNEKTISNINFTNSLDNTLERDIEIFIEATGNPIIGTVHAAKIIKSKKHIILVQ